MKRHTTTIKDIARELNISVATVSRALRNTHDVKSATRQAVLEKAAQLRYQPNFNAIGLVKNSSNNIGIVLPAIANYYFSTVVTGIQEVAFRNGFNMVLYLTNDSGEREKEILNDLSLGNVDGLLVCVSSLPGEIEHFQRVIDNDVPIVFFDRDAPGINTSRIMQDDFNGAFQAVEYLVRCGYTRIAHIGGPEGLMLTRRRLDGYLAALRQFGLPVCPEWITHSAFTLGAGLQDMQQILDCKDRPEAVFAANDRKAVGAIMTLNKNNIRVGAGIGVIGFTNDPISEIVQPPLTTMEEPAFDIGRIGCELLMKHIQKKHFIAEEIILPSRLIVRESTRRSKD